jgi:hypothetical protein
MERNPAATRPATFAAEEDSISGRGSSRREVPARQSSVNQPFFYAIQAVD